MKDSQALQSRDATKTPSDATQKPTDGNNIGALDPAQYQSGAKPGDRPPATDTAAAHLPPLTLDNSEEKKGNTAIKKDDKGNAKEYDNGDYTLSKHDDGKWYFHQNGDGHDFVEVDGNSIKMDDKGKVTYNESGMFGNNDQTLGNGSTGGLNDITNVVSTVSNDIVQTATDVWHDPTNIGAVFNDVTHAASDVVNGVSTLATDAVHAAEDVGKNVVLGVEGYGQGMVNGAIDTFNHFAKEAHEGWGLPSLHIDDLTLPNQAEVDKSWGGQAGQFIGGLGSTLTQAVGDMAVDLGKATYNWDKMMVNDATTLIDDAINDPSKLGSDFGEMGQQALDFGKGFVEGIAIKPINGVIGGVDSALNWATDSHDFDNRFKLGNLVDEEYERTHPAAKMGDVVGDIALQAALIVATDGVSEAVIGAGRNVIAAGSRVLSRGARGTEGFEEGAAGFVPRGELPKQSLPKPDELPKTPPSTAELSKLQRGDKVSIDDGAGGKLEYTADRFADGTVALVDRTGLKIALKGGSPEFQAKMLREIESLPEAERQLLASQDCPISVVSKISDIDPSLAHLHPQGHDPLTTWDDLDGVFMHQPPNVVVAETTNAGLTTRAEGVLRHEFGHGVDMAKGNFSASPAFENAYNTDLHDLISGSIKGDITDAATAGQLHDLHAMFREFDYYVQVGNNYAGRAEAFADTYAALIGSAANPQETAKILAAFPTVARAIKYNLGMS